MHHSKKYIGLFLGVILWGLNPSWAMNHDGNIFLKKMLVENLEKSADHLASLANIFSSYQETLEKMKAASFSTKSFNKLKKKVFLEKSKNFKTASMLLSEALFNVSSKAKVLYDMYNTVDTIAAVTLDLKTYLDFAQNMNFTSVEKHCYESSILKNAILTSIENNSRNDIRLPILQRLKSVLEGEMSSADAISSTIGDLESIKKGGFKLQFYSKVRYYSELRWLDKVQRHRIETLLSGQNIKFRHYSFGNNYNIRCESFHTFADAIGAGGNRSSMGCYSLDDGKRYKVFLLGVGAMLSTGELNLKILSPKRILVGGIWAGVGLTVNVLGGLGGGIYMGKYGSILLMEQHSVGLGGMAPLGFYIEPIGQ